MWLLDVNLPTGLLALLRGCGISCDTTANRGWRDLTNGLLAEAAFGAGFRVILTRDRSLTSTGRVSGREAVMAGAHSTRTGEKAVCAAFYEAARMFRGPGRRPRCK
jgi:hypothetical protein